MNLLADRFSFSPRWAFVQAAGFALLLCLTGCDTTRLAKSDVVEGLVIDSSNDQPIKGATVMFLGRPKTSVKTDSDGLFVVGPAYVEVPVELGFRLTYSPTTQLEISAPGYRTTRFQAYRPVTWTRKSQTPIPKFKVISLVPEA